VTPRLRKVSLTAHISASVAWLGAVAAFLVLNIAGLASRDVETVRGAYFAMNLIGRFVIFPLSLTALATGFVQALGTEWGLFRHFWILAKLMLTLFSTIVLMAKIPLMGRATRLAADMTLPRADLRLAGMQLLIHSAGGLLVLLTITTLSVFKPWGRTRYGQREQHQDRHEKLAATPLSTPTLPGAENEMTANGSSMALKIFFSVIGVIVVALIVLHLFSGGLGSHGR